MSGVYSMMTLGSFTFEISTAVYQELKRTTEYLWPSQQRFGASPAVQATGLGDDTMQLPGVIYPEWNGGTGQVDRMREIAGEMKPLSMIDGRGNVMGRWVIERVEEGQSIFAQAGVARKQEFTLSLKKFDDEGEHSIFSSKINFGIASAPLTNGGLSPLPAIPSTLSDAVSAVKTVTATANAALSTASTISGKIGSALNSVAHIAPALGIHAPAITKALNRSLGVVNGIRTSASGGLDILRTVQTVGSAASSAQRMLNDVSSMVQPATGSSTGIKSSLSALTASGATQDALNVVTGALVAANKATALASSLRDNTNTIVKRIGSA